MKKVTIIVMLCCFSVVVLNCSSTDESALRGDGAFIRATVETLSFESSNVSNGATAAKIDGGDFMTFIVQGFNTAGNSLSILIPEYEGAGTYDLGNDNGSFTASGVFANQAFAWSSANEGGTGSVVVLTDDDEETTGSFEFLGVQGDDASSTRNVTSGSFRVLFE